MFSDLQEDTSIRPSGSFCIRGHKRVCLPPRLDDRVTQTQLGVSRMHTHRASHWSRPYVSQRHLLGGLCRLAAWELNLTLTS